MKTWKNISLFVALPIIGVVTYTSFTAPHHDLPEFKPYPHLRIRRKVPPLLVSPHR